MYRFRGGTKIGLETIKKGKGREEEAGTLYMEYGVRGVCRDSKAKQNGEKAADGVAFGAQTKTGRETKEKENGERRRGTGYKGYRVRSAIKERQGEEMKGKGREKAGDAPQPSPTLVLP